jgi:hypothetical protein
MRSPSVEFRAYTSVKIPLASASVSFYRIHY